MWQDESMGYEKWLKFSNTFIKMHKKTRSLLAALIVSTLLSGCIGTLWTGASTLYDRHYMYLKLNDYHLSAQVNEVLAVNKTFVNEACIIDIAVFNGDILLAGHLPSAEMMEEFNARINKVHGYRRLFNKMVIKQASSNSVQDSWITGKIRSQIFADSSINPKAFKIVTTDRIVYLMGDVQPDQAEKVVNIARNTEGVVKVVKLLRYLVYLSTQKNMA